MLKETSDRLRQKLDRLDKLEERLKIEIIEK
jgi:hypothetical protein